MNIKSLVKQKIEEYVRNHPGNRNTDGTCYFESPLVGFASVNNQLFDEYTKLIGPFHWTPARVLEMFTNSKEPFGGTVVSWILPITERTRHSNREQDKFPSREWAQTRDFGEQFNDELRRLVEEFLIKQGGTAVAPVLLEAWSRVTDPEVGLASRWSERHIAYAAGLGTFSLNRGLITPRGIAHRCGSVVTNIVMEPSEFPYWDYRENCLTCMGKECGECIKRCPVGAISIDGHDKARCMKYTYGPSFKALAKKFGTSVTGCGLCQTKVPCEYEIPVGVKRKDTTFVSEPVKNKSKK